MAANASAPVRDDTDRIDRYDEMAEECEEVIGWIDEKLEDGRIRDPEHARARQGYLRLKLKAIDTWRKLQSDRDLEDLSRRIEELERGQL